jgi:DNA-directed RNA polymerase specialized sigma24 family protein
MSVNTSPAWLSTALSHDDTADSDLKMYVDKILEKAHAENHKEIEMLILSISNYTHKDIAKALNISRLGVTARINRAKEILKEAFNDYIP